MLALALPAPARAAKEMTGESSLTPQPERRSGDGRFELTARLQPASPETPSTGLAGKAGLVEQTGGICTAPTDRIFINGFE